jgi:uncharacterized damage-inducible protein DinB
MTITQSFLHEIEMAVPPTQKILERVPDGKFDWVPHEKSMTMGRLASHVAELMGWIPGIVAQDSLDIAPVGGEPYSPPQNDTVEGLLKTLDDSANAARAALAKVDDSIMMDPWSLLSGGETVFTAPRAGVVRNMIFNHLVHHRAQLGVYLRLNDIPVPNTFGPTADETSF